MLVALVALLAGCSRSGGPSVSLVTIYFKEASALETKAEFVLRLSNETPEAKQFTGGTHKIYINDLYVGKGLSDEIIAVPRLGTVTQAVTVYMNNLALATRIKAVIEAKRFDYKIQSTFFGDSMFSRWRSETSGKLDLKDFTSSETNDVLEEPPASAPPRSVSNRVVPAGAGE